MQEWAKISLLVCVFGFIREIRPSESFLSPFILDKQWRNISSEELNRDIFPVGTYSYLAQSFVIFLITDFFRYKPVIIICGLSGLVMSCLLIWTKSLFGLQLMEFFFGTYMAAEVAYYTYIYAKVDKRHYPKVTSHTRAAMFFGRLLASSSSQLLVSFKVMDYLELNYITFSAQIACTLWAFGLPAVKHSQYFHNENLEALEALNKSEGNSKKTNNVKSAFKLLWSHFKSGYLNKHILLWSIWYAIAIAGNLQILAYTQVLWDDIVGPDNDMIIWNGAVEAISTLLAALSAILAGYCDTSKLNLRTSIFILAILTFLEGAFIMLMTWIRNLYVSYVGYILYIALHAFTITVTSTEISRNLEEDSFGLIFGINTTVGLVLQTLLTIIFISDIGFGMNISDQYTTYAYYYIVIGFSYFIYIIYDFITQRKPKSNNIT